MKTIDLIKVLSNYNDDVDRQLGLFALLSLGVVELLASGAVSAADSTRVFFNADNCLYVRKKLRDQTADRIMSHGVQLQDLFDTLPNREAQQEFQKELGSIRSLCLRLVEQHQLVA
jgi:hypothetical protein